MKTLFFVSLLALSFISVAQEQTWTYVPNLKCDVTYQQNTVENYEVEPLASVKTIEFNHQYQPINIVADGVSLNEWILYPEKDFDEVWNRSLQHIDVWTDGIEYEIILTNDWDTYELSISLFKLEENTYFGTMVAYWDDRYMYQMACTEQ